MGWSVTTSPKPTQMEKNTRIVMKQYTTPEQTAKLIELGFEKPNSSIECELPEADWRIGAVGIRKAYSIGELIEMLPMNINNEGSFEEILIHPNYNRWVVKYSGIFREPTYQSCMKELVDALYDMVIKLKEEGVI